MSSSGATTKHCVSVKQGTSTAACSWQTCAQHTFSWALDWSKWRNQVASVVHSFKSSAPSLVGPHERHCVT